MIIKKKKQQRRAKAIYIFHRVKKNSSGVLILRLIQKVTTAFLLFKADLQQFVSMSLPNKAGIITPNDKIENQEEITMLIMPVMLNSD